MPVPRPVEAMPLAEIAAKSGQIAGEAIDAGLI